MVLAELILSNGFIKVIETILSYYIPGYIFLKIIGNTTGSEETPEKIFSVVISYLIVWVVKAIPVKCIQNNQELFYIIFAIGCAFIISFIYKNFGDKLNSLILNHFGATRKNVIYDTINNKKGAYVMLSLKSYPEIEYCGVLGSYDMGVEPKFIAVTQIKSEDCLYKYSMIIKIDEIARFRILENGDSNDSNN